MPHCMLFVYISSLYNIQKIFQKYLSTTVNLENFVLLKIHVLKLLWFDLAHKIFSKIVVHKLVHVRNGRT